MQHRPAIVPQQHSTQFSHVQPNGHGSNGHYQVPSQQQPLVSAPVSAQPAQMRAPEPVLDPAQRAELESIFPVSSGREPMGRHPLSPAITEPLTC